MKQNISHVNKVWRQMSADLHAVDATSNYMMVRSWDDELSMHIVLINRADTMARVFWIKDYDCGDLFRTTINTSRLLGRYIFCDIDWLKDVAYDFAGVISSDKEYNVYEPFYDDFYPNLIKQYKSKIKYLYNMEVKNEKAEK